MGGLIRYIRPGGHDHSVIVTEGVCPCLSCLHDPFCRENRLSADRQGEIEILVVEPHTGGLTSEEPECGRTPEVAGGGGENPLYPYPASSAVAGRVSSGQMTLL